MENILSEIQIIPIKPIDGLVAFASIVYNNSIFLSSIGIYTRPEGGYRITYPKKGSFNIFHPINAYLGKEIEKAILDKYEKLIQSVQPNKTNNPST